MLSLAARKKSSKASGKISFARAKVPRVPDKIIITKDKDKPDKSFPWALFADCMLMLVFIFSNGWKFRLDVQLYFVISAAVIFIIQMFRKENRNRLFSRISLILVVILAQCLLYFVGLFYAYYPKFALQEFFMNVGSLFVFATAYVSFLRNEINFRRLVLIISAVIAFASLASIELATSGFLHRLFVNIAGLLNAQIADGYGAFETNTRITTVLGAPNVFAPMTVLAMFGSLWTCGRAGEREKSSFIHMSLAVVNGIAFVLCFSLGTILCYGAAFLIYIIATDKENRGTHLLRHLYCVFLSLIGAGLVFALRNLSILPLASTVLLSFLAAFVYTRLKLGKLPALKCKRGIITAAVVICTGAIVIAASLHGPYFMTEGASFNRAVALKPGTYTIRISADRPDAPLKVNLSSQSYTEAALKVKTPIKNAELQSGETIDFTVPEGSAAVFFTISATNDLVLTDVVITGGNTLLNLPLRYKLLPEFIVNRLQGLWVNDNAIQRFIFFRDGIRLGMRSPIIGLGGGAYEGGVFSVADYYYQTKHVHNEFIQRYIDGGLLGLLLFAALPFALFRTLYKARYNEKAKPYFVFLFACMSMIFLHSLLEVDFLMVGYRIVSMVLFGGVAALGEDTIVIRNHAKTAIKASFVLTVVVTVLLSFGRYFANKAIDKTRTLEAVQDAIWMDYFNKTDYMLIFLLNTTALSDPYTVDIQNKYLSSLDNQIVGADAVAQIYLTGNQPDGVKGTSAAELFIRENRVKPDAWNAIFSLYISVLNAGVDRATSDAIIGSGCRLLDYLDELNNTLPLEIMPDSALLSMLETKLYEQQG